MTILRFVAPALAGALLFIAMPALAWVESISGDMNQVLLDKCTSCHDLERVGIALQQGRSLEEIQEAMITRGAVLTSEDKQILGTFWGPASRKVTPAEEPTPVAAPVSAKEAAELDRVIRARCLQCHTRDRIDKAIAKRLPFEPIEQQMMQRGATLTPQEQQTLKIFWENPHR